MVQFTHTVTLSHDTVDNIVSDVLIQDYQSLSESVIELESSDNLPDYKARDLDDNRRYMLALKTVLGYYLPPDRYFEVVGEPLYD